MKKSTIQFEFSLDDQHLPEEIAWAASDAGMDGWQPAKAIMLSVWDPNQSSTLKIDLWTKDMLVQDMKIFMHQTLLSMASMLEKSANESAMAGDMRDFCDYFANKMNLTQDGNTGRNS